MFQKDRKSNITCPWEYIAILINVLLIDMYIVGAAPPIEYPPENFLLQPSESCDIDSTCSRSPNNSIYSWQLNSYVLDPTPKSAR